MLRFYMNGTAGAKDGTEISSNTLSNPLIADGFYPASGVAVSKDITVCIRADSGGDLEKRSYCGCVNRHR